MARVTGSPCAIMARLIAREEYSREGVSPAEYIGQNHTIYRKLMKELEKKDIFYKETVEEI
jgi:saccharopine dehydrogenase-like NADP-dependent oxidoreductase